MSYTTERQPQGMERNIETFLREGMIAEIVAIDDYSHFISLTDNKEVKDIFYQIMKREKVHYGMFLDALRKVDREEGELKRKIYSEINIYSKQKYKESTKVEKGDLLDAIRILIKGELEAIILYEEFINNIKDQSIVCIINQIIREEKEHVEELTKALTTIDEDSYGPISEVSHRGMIYRKNK
ncbi:ferritin-like domain-containing protein [Clostridium sardiniense]|uniref:Ferritin-like domain-containing protein n=1 Tax=Clostridium sardiniense TaxID=29369 RepID=A0ABS7L1P3_CLOSR|nr:ferritin-like domain-containing protein [Clostridium sardiniense]MBY0756757.1 ferritin-like domain-containing protein [Clostridium sardiniense]MDQ0460442.1 rubrerythrin [Clostridium sardiniense]